MLHIFYLNLIIIISSTFADELHLQLHSSYKGTNLDQLIMHRIDAILQPTNLIDCTFIRITAGEMRQEILTKFEYFKGIELLDLNPKIIIHFNNNSLNNMNSFSNITNLPYLKSQYASSCSFVSYFLDKATDWFQINVNFVNSIPGGIFGSYHLIFTEIGPEKYFQSNVPVIVSQMHNLILINKYRKGFEIFTPNVWYNGSHSLASYRDGWYEEDIEIYRSKWQNYGNGPLIVATTPDITPADLDEYFHSRVITKYIIVSAVEFTRYLNTTPRILSVQPAIYGKKDKNGKWFGVIAEVWKGNAHFSSPVAISWERTEIISYTQVHAFDHVVFITGLPKKSNLSGSLSFLIYPFTFHVWMGTILSLCLIFMTLILNKRLEIGK